MKKIRIQKIKKRLQKLERIITKHTIQNITGRYFMGNLYVHRGASDNLLDIFDK